MPTVEMLRCMMAGADEEALWAMYKSELEGECRQYILEDIYSKATRLRRQRERREMARLVANK